MTQSDLDNIAYNKFANGEITLAEYIKYENRDQVMNYKERYEQALKRARDLMTNQNPPAFNKDLISLVFPELKESEDERIKREILDYINELANLKNEKIPTEWLAWLEKQCEQPTDKVKPKFKVGDWVVQGYNILKIKCVGDTHYCFETVDSYVDDMLVSEIDSQFHLWTIQDAKDGDVLVDSYSKDSIIILYKGIDKERSILAHCGWNGYNFSVKTNGFGYGGLDNTNFLPATEEQRDLLFAKVKEAGYEWDADKKKLKKIEPKMLNADKVIAWLVGNIIDFEDYVQQFKKDFRL